MVKFICEEALQDGYKFSESGIYKSISGTTHQDYIDYIQ